MFFIYKLHSENKRYYFAQCSAAVVDALQAGELPGLLHQGGGAGRRRDAHLRQVQDAPKIDQVVHHPALPQVSSHSYVSPRAYFVHPRRRYTNCIAFDQIRRPEALLGDALEQADQHRGVPDRRARPGHGAVRGQRCPVRQVHAVWHFESYG